MLHIEPFVVNSFQENTYLVWEETSLECIIVDAGCYENEEFKRLERYIEEKDLKIKSLVKNQ